MSDDFDWTPHLEDGEKVLWQGRPDGRYKLFLTLTDYVHVPIFTLFLVPAGFMVYRAIADQSSSLLFDIPFALITASIFLLILFMAVGRSGLDKLRRQRYRYAVTSHRILLADAKTTGLLSTVDLTPELSLEVLTNAPVTLRASKWLNPNQQDARPYFYLSKPDANGPIVKAANAFSQFGWPDRNGYTEKGLELRILADGKAVAKLIRDQIAKMKAPSP